VLSAARLVAPGTATRAAEVRLPVAVRLAVPATASFAVAVTVALAASVASPATGKVPEPPQVVPSAFHAAVFHEPSAMAFDGAPDSAVRLAEAVRLVVPATASFAVAVTVALAASGAVPATGTETGEPSQVAPSAFHAAVFHEPSGMVFDQGFWVGGLRAKAESDRINGSRGYVV
jgi:FlaG/FlaF family flagellin (archaellin)